MEHNEEIRNNEVVAINEDHYETYEQPSESGSGFDTTVKVGIGALVGIAAYKGFGVIKRKWKARKEAKAAEAEVIVVDADDVSENED